MHDLVDVNYRPTNGKGTVYKTFSNIYSVQKAVEIFMCTDWYWKQSLFCVVNSDR